MALKFGKDFIYFKIICMNCLEKLSSSDALKRYLHGSSLRAASAIENLQLPTNGGEPKTSSAPVPTDTFQFQKLVKQCASQTNQDL